MKTITQSILETISDHIIDNNKLYGKSWQGNKLEILNKLSNININYIESPEEFDNLSSGNCVTFICTKCGNLVFNPSSFRKGKIDSFKRMMCYRCSKEETNIERFGVSNPMKNPEISARALNTWNNKSQEELDDILSRRSETRRNKPQEEKDKTTAKVKATKLRNHGDENYNNLEKNKATCLERYGVEHPLQNQEIYNKMLATKETRHGDPHYNNLEKRHATCQERYGTNNACEAPEVIEKINKATIEKLGVKRPLQIPEILNRMQDTMELLYDGRTTMQSPELRKRVEETNLNTYGTVCTLGNKEVREKSKQSLLEHTGRDHPIVNKLNYYGVSFDSMWELALWIYAKDHNEFIVREPISIQYEYEGVVHHCYPDFYYQGQIIEIKGDHLVGSNNAFDDDKHKVKQQAELASGIIFWLKEDIQFAINYVNSTYGKSYLQQFYSNNPFNPSYSSPDGYIPIVKPYYLMNLYYSAPAFPNKGITPYDIDQTQSYSPVSGQGITPFDIK